MKDFIKKLDIVLKNLFSNNRTSVLLSMFLVFYGGLAGPKLSNSITELFKNPVFRIFILSLIVYKSNNDPRLSILISLIFVLVLDNINKIKIFENFTNKLNTEINENENKD